MDKVQQHAESQNSKVASSQGGSNQNAGPDTASDVKTGPGITSQFDKQDNARSQGGAPANPYHDV